MTFKPKVLNAEPNRELRGQAAYRCRACSMVIHSFTIEPLGNNRISFIQREAFKGLLVPWLARSLDTNTQRGFEEMNHALKERAEAAPAEQTYLGTSADLAFHALR